MNLSEVTDISVTLNVAIVSQIYAYVQTHQNNALNMHRFFVCLLQLNKAVKKKISKPGVLTNQSKCAGPGPIRMEACQDNSHPPLLAVSGFNLLVTESQGHSRESQGKDSLGCGGSAVAVYLWGITPFQYLSLQLLHGDGIQSLDMGLDFSFLHS